MLEHDAGNGHLEAAGIGEVGQAHPARLLDLREDDVAGRAVQGFPGGDPPLESPSHGWPDLLGAPSGQLAQDRHRAQPGGCLEQRHHHLVPMTGERVGPRAIGPRPRLVLGGRGSCSMRRAVATEMPALAAAVTCIWSIRSRM